MMMNPLDLTAGPFLALYALLAAAILLWGLWRREWIGGPARIRARPLNELELAFLTAGDWRVGDAALIRLLERKGASIGTDGRIDVTDPSSLSGYVGQMPTLHFAKGVTRGQFQATIEPLVDRIREQLRSRERAEFRRDGSSPIRRRPCSPRTAAARPSPRET